MYTLWNNVPKLLSTLMFYNSSISLPSNRFNNCCCQNWKIINVKKGQFLAPWDMANVAEKIEESGNKNILITERGASFGYNTLVSDMRALPIMSKFGFPIVFDATHSVQQPGGMGEKAETKNLFYLARAAIAVGVGAIFMETHEDPDNAPSDGPNMVPLNEVKVLLKKLTEIDKLANKRMAKIKVLKGDKF